jgi:hypothetical protein
MLKSRIKKLEKAVNSQEQRIIVLDELTYYKENGKYYAEATNGKEWVKYEIDPHRELFDEEYEEEEKMVEQKGVNENDMVLLIMGVGNLKEKNDEEIVYQETYEGKTKALTRHGKAW